MFSPSKFYVLVSTGTLESDLLSLSKYPWLIFIRFHKGTTIHIILCNELSMAEIEALLTEACTGHFFEAVCTN